MGLRVISMSTFCEVGSTGRIVCAAKFGGGWPDTGRPLASAGWQAAGASDTAIKFNSL